MQVQLTETAIRAAAKRAADTGERQELTDAKQPGLRLRVTPSGKHSWALACRDSLGAMRRFLLGEFPKMGVADAREAARTMRVEVGKGADPVVERRRKRAIGRDARDGIGTLKSLVELYEKQRGGALRSWPESRRRIESVFAAHLSRPLATLRAGDLQLTADGHKAKQSAAAAVRYIRPVLKWAGQRGYVGVEVALLHQPATVQRRDRVLNRDELGALLPVLDKSERPYAAALHFMLLTLARREEVAGAVWSSVNLEAKVWTIPVTKNGQAHRVPLSNQAAALLTALKPGKPGSLVFHVSSGMRLVNWDRETKLIQDASETKGWTRHDLRRTGATLLGEMGFDPHVIEAALNHTAIHSQLAATYNRSRYMPEVKRALQALADRLDGIANGGAEVVLLTSHRAATH